MTEDGPIVLVAGTEGDRVGELAGSLDSSLAVRTSASTDAESWPTTDVAVAVFADAIPDEFDPDELPEDVARVAVLENPDEFDHPTACDRTFVEPLVPDDLDATVTSLARRVQYDRRLRECAELAARSTRAESNCNGAVTTDSGHLREEVATAKAEIDGLVTEFSSEDFRQAFRTLAAD